MNSISISALEELKQKFSGIIATDVDMQKMSHWRIGGKILAVASPRTLEEIIEIRSWLHQNELPNFIIGNTTNLLFTDKQINAVAIQASAPLNGIHIDGTTVTAQAGMYVPYLARKAMKAGLSGLEHTCGIPGTLGGLVTMNGGSQRKGIGDHISSVKTITDAGRIKTYSKEACNFAYRSSSFQSSSDLIFEVSIELNREKEKGSSRREMLEIMRSRNSKFPRRQPNCGSVFVSNPSMYSEYGPPGKIIEELGFKGISKGGAQVSPAHANFIVNNGGATAEDVLYLIRKIKGTIRKKTGYLMEVEAKYVDENGRISPIET